MTSRLNYFGNQFNDLCFADSFTQYISDEATLLQLDLIHAKAAKTDDETYT